MKIEAWRECYMHRAFFRSGLLFKSGMENMGRALELAIQTTQR